MKKLCVSLMALVSLLCVSCSNDPEIPEKNDNGIDVTLSITTNPLTKGVENSQVDASAPIDVNKEFIVYFMDASGNTVTAYKLTDTQISAIQTSTVGAGVKFTNLDPSVVSVYVVANVPSGTLPATAPGTTLTAINGTVQNIYDQQTIDAKSVVLANTGKTATSTNAVAAPNDVASNGNAQYKATIVLTPIVSRIQIKEVSVDPTITSFNLAGIYIDNFYQNMSIGGDLTSISKAPVGGVTKFNLSSDGSTPYKTNGQLFDELISPATTLPLVTNGKVFGYQIFPVAGGLSKVPYIILKLTNVVGTTRTFASGTTYYVAVKAYKDGSNPFTTFEAGKIYTINSIPVAENNIVTDPTQSLINVTVNVTIAPWSEKALNPDFGY